MIKDPRFHSNPEKIIEDGIRFDLLPARGWLVEKTHSTAFSSGWPDLFCWHPHFGLRWVDVKNPKAYRYTKAQIQTWPKWEAMGLGVWIMMEASEAEYQKLFQPPNFREFWRPSYDQYLLNVEDIIEEILDGDE